MKIEFTAFNKQKVIVLDNEIGLQIFLVNGGASVWKVVFDGKIMNLVPKTWPEFFNKNIYYGKTIGPIANRVKGGKVVIDDKEYQMEQNEGENTLHSGTYGLSNHAFSFSGAIRNEKFHAISYTLKTRKMKNGLPGNIVYQVTYVIYPNENKFSILYSARSDADTVMSLTNHLFFTLGDSNLDDMYMTIPAHKFVYTDKNSLIPVEVKDVPNCLDFQKSKKLTKDINDPFIKDHRTNGYDHCFVLNKGCKDPVILENSKYKLSITSDFDSVQIYTDNYGDDNVVLTSTEKVCRSVAIEPEDNIYESHPLKKGEQYSRQIDYKFEKK